MKDKLNKEMSATSIARQYFELSNARDLGAIENLFADEATYSSDNTGLYFGKQDIMDMVQAFFDSFPYLHWAIDSIEEKTPQIVEIYFTVSSRNRDGNEINRKGKETVVVTDRKIRHVEVRNLD